MPFPFFFSSSSNAAPPQPSPSPRSASSREQHSTPSPATTPRSTSLVHAQVAKQRSSTSFATAPPSPKRAEERLSISLVPPSPTDAKQRFSTSLVPRSPSDAKQRSSSSFVPPSPTASKKRSSTSSAGSREARLRASSLTLPPIQTGSRQQSASSLIPASPKNGPKQPPSPNVVRYPSLTSLDRPSSPTIVNGPLTPSHAAPPSPKVAKQKTLPVAQFVDEEPHDMLPLATPVRVIDAAAATQPQPPGIVTLATPELPSDAVETAPQLPDPAGTTRKKKRTKKNLWITCFLLFLLAGALAGGGYAVFQFVSQPTTAAKETIPVGRPPLSFTRAPTSPTPPTTRSPTTTRAPTPPTPEVYGIELVYSPTPMPAQIKNVLEVAKAKWQSILVEPGVSPQPPAGAMLCDHPERTYDGTETIDDLEIWVDVAPIDGVGTVLGYAGPCGLVAGNTFRSVTGEMVFDIADIEQLLQDGSLVDVITHEMGHVLGVGSYWGAAYSGVVVPPSYTYTGLNGRAGYKDVNNNVDGNPPIELHGGEGTAYTHWDDATFGNELMTGYISSGSNPLSKLTVRSLVDLGYIVNVNNADSYQRPGVGRRRLRGSDNEGDLSSGTRSRHRMHQDSLAFHRKKFDIVRVFNFAENDTVGNGQGHGSKRMHNRTIDEPGEA